MRLCTALIILGLALLASGCATQMRSQQLTRRLSAYHAALRWGGFAKAEAFVDPAWRRAHPLTRLQRDRYAQVRVSDYDDAGPVAVSKDEVRQTVQIQFINRNTEDEHSIVDHQLWKYDADKGRWWLESGLPDITQGR